MMGGASGGVGGACGVGVGMANGRVGGPVVEWEEPVVLGWVWPMEG